MKGRGSDRHYRPGNKDQAWKNKEQGKERQAKHTKRAKLAKRDEKG